jgi:hypothetical protein
MRASRAGTRSRLLRLGLSAGAASIGAVALSLLVGVAPASASDDHADGLGGLVQRLGGAVGAAAATATDPAESVEVGLQETIAPVAHAAPAVTAPVGDAAEAVTAPVIERAAPVVRPVVQATTVPVEVLRDSARPVADALAPVLPPLTPVVDPVEPVVGVVVEHVLGDTVAPVIAPVVGVVDRVVDAVPIAGESLEDEPVAGVLDPVIGLVPVIEPLPGGVLPGDSTPMPGGSMPGLGLEPEPASPPAAAAEAETSAPHESSAVVTAAPAFATANAPRLEPTRTAALITAAAEPSTAMSSAGHDRDVTGAPLRSPDGVVPSAASGIAAGVASPLADIHDHPLLALAAGRVGALESDRAPSSPAEEHTASPD